VRLLCLPYGGRGSSLFRSWPGSLPASADLWAVELPGRERRFAEPAISGIGQLLDQLTPALEPLLDLPVVLFGHSMGALIAYRLAVALQERFAAGPATLVLSGAHAPWAEESPTKRLTALTDDELLGEFEKWGGSAAELRKHPHLLEMMLPTVRADFALCESVSALPAPAKPELSCRLVLMGGRDDPHYRPASALAWRDITTAPPVQQSFAGGHFFMDSDAAGLLRVLGDEAELAAG
jgi:medium-chain acyl-[acyl-carrier-protein] hydrolase